MSEKNCTTVHNQDTPENWQAFLKARDAGEVCEVTEEIFYYFLEVLPPVWMNKTIEFADIGPRTCVFGFAEGRELITAFWSEGERYTDEARYFCKLTDKINRS